MTEAPPDEVGEFEDEFEDEFESEDEILEAGVDGRPDAEREEEEKGKLSCSSGYTGSALIAPVSYRCDGGRPADFHSRKNETRSRRGAFARPFYV